MKTLISFSFSLWLFACTNSNAQINNALPVDRRDNVTDSKPIQEADDFSVEILIPQNSGLAFVSYKVYTIKDDSFYVSDRHPFDTSKIIKYLKIYPVDKNKINELKAAVARVDSIGHLSSYCSDIFLGRTRFFIFLNHDGRKIDGFVASRYRKDIFEIVDIVNDISPERKVVGYDKDELLKHEADCKERKSEEEK